jgi:hypothetical protein
MTGTQVRELCDAFCSAFTLDTLGEMLRYRLDKSLAEVVGSGNLRAVVFNVVEASIREGWSSKLIRAAISDNPGNPTLRSFGEQYPDLIADSDKFARPAAHAGSRAEDGSIADESPRSEATRPYPVVAPSGALLKILTYRWLVLGLAAAALALSVATYVALRRNQNHIDDPGGPGIATDDPGGPHATVPSGGPLVIGFGTEPSTDRDRPTLLKSNEIRGTVVQREKTRYYLQFTAGPGKLETTLDFTAASSWYLQHVSVIHFDQKAKALGEVSINISSKDNKRVVRPILLDKRQTVIMQIETGSMDRTMGGKYLIFLKGPAWSP